MKTVRISELGRRFGLSRSTLLYYDRIGLLRPGSRNQSGYRQYTPADIERLERICLFREAGLDLSHIASLLDSDVSPLTALERRLQEINGEMVALKTQQRLIARMLGKVSAGFEASGLDKTLWLDLQKTCGLDSKALQKWHLEFEQRAPAAHHEFLLRMGLSEKEALQVRMLTGSMENNQMTMTYFFELFEALPRQGPGCASATLQALHLLTRLPPSPAVLDIGCGCGVQTQILAKTLNTRVLAIDNHQPFLDRLAQTAITQGLEIETREMSMIDMDFQTERFDLLWAEGSIFIIGLARGLAEFIPLLKPGGYLAFSEMCWFEDTPPAEIQTYLNEVYPDIRSVPAVCQMAVDAGYRVIDSFNLPDNAWWDDYYTPMLQRIAELKEKHAGIPQAQNIYANCEKEAEMHRRFCGSYGYTFFVLQKPQQAAKMIGAGTPV